MSDDRHLPTFLSPFQRLVAYVSVSTTLHSQAASVMQRPISRAPRTHVPVLRRLGDHKPVFDIWIKIKVRARKKDIRRGSKRPKREKMEVGSYRIRLVRQADTELTIDPTDITYSSMITNMDHASSRKGKEVLGITMLNPKISLRSCSLDHRHRRSA